MKMMIAAALLAAPMQNDVRADHFCSELQGLAAGAEESPAFASLAGSSLHSLLQGYCVIGRPAETAILCTRSLLPDSITRDSLIARMEVCLPGLRVTRPASIRDDILIEHGRLRIEMAENGGKGAHVGRIITLYIRAAR